MRRSIAAIALLVSLVFGVSSPAAAISMTLSPSFQIRGHGQNASWVANWGVNPPYTVHFTFGDGSEAAWLVETNQTSRSWSHKFYPCSSTTFTEEFYVLEHSKANGLITSRTAVDGGNPC